MPASSEFAVYSRAPRALVWSVFAQIEEWHKWGASYGEVRWTLGTPWAKGSHFVTELLYPVRVNVEHTVLICTPEEMVNWVVHAVGVTIERLILFQDTPVGTEIKTSSLITGTPNMELGGDLGELLDQFTKRWYQELAAYCDTLVVGREADR